MGGLNYVSRKIFVTSFPRSPHGSGTIRRLIGEVCSGSAFPPADLQHMKA